MTTTPNPTAEQAIAEALNDMWGGETHDGSPWSPEGSEVITIADKLRAHGLLSEGAPSEEPVEAHVSHIARNLARATELTGASAEVIARAALKLAAGVAPQPVIDEAALTEVVFNTVEKWADMYPTPQVSEMITRAVAAWLRDGAAPQEPCPQPCEHLSAEDAREGRDCREHPCTCPTAPSTDRQKLIDEAQAFERAPKLGLSAHRELDKAILLIRRLWPALDAPLDPEKVAAITWDLVDVSPERQDLLARALCEAYTEGKLT